MLKCAQDFKDWDHSLPYPFRAGEWEDEYPKWDEAYAEAISFVKTPHETWDERSIADLLYIIGRDRECERILDFVKEYPEKIRFLLKKCVASRESDAKWLLVNAIFFLEIWDDEIEKTIYDIYFDRSPYVQRICLMKLAEKKSKFTMELARYSYGTFDQYQHVAVLWALFWIEYPNIEEYLDLAVSENSIIAGLKRSNVIEVQVDEIRLKLNERELKSMKFKKIPSPGVKAYRSRGRKN